MAMEKPMMEEMEDDTENEGPDEWEIRCWADKLIEAEEIKSDPEKMKLVKPFLDKKVKAITSVAQLREVAKQKGFSR